ncbi:Nephrin [Armadillidium nasatum]|uniref:Nephrin n=1 Tax=Armadillidium nasatum TaxID=96803 RepID=A0A5N5STS0_9CRUS|nr:Nephrin [Armadillidium nasatum]
MPLETPSYLLLNELKEEDEGIYTCFIVYKNQLSETLKTSLKIIVPPVSIKIFDSKLEELQKKSNKLQENSTAEFTCQVTGGRPAPIITWWKGAVLLDNKVDDEGTQVLRNRLQYGPLTRDDEGVDLVCQASNSNLTSPLNKKITLDINFPPLTAEIITQDTPLVADSEFTIVCKSSGAKPPALITWLLDDKVLNTTRDFTINNGRTTQSELKFIPTKEDGGKTLTCKAESSVLLTKPLTDKRLLDIHCES